MIMKYRDYTINIKKTVTISLPNNAASTDEAVDKYIADKINHNIVFRKDDYTIDDVKDGEEFGE